MNIISVNKPYGVLNAAVPNLITFTNALGFTSITLDSVNKP